MTSYLPYVAILLSVGGLILGILTYRRAGLWKDSEEAKAMVVKMDSHGNRLTTLETQMTHLATKSDLAKLEGEIGGIKEVVDDVKEGVGEIRRWIMQEGSKS